MYKFFSARYINMIYSVAGFAKKLLGFKPAFAWFAHEPQARLDYTRAAAEIVVFFYYLFL